MSHLSTCGRDCPGEPVCSETADVVCGATDEQLRARYGLLSIDVPCERPGCVARAGEFCRLDRPGSRHYHGERGLLAHHARLLRQILEPSDIDAALAADPDAYQKLWAEYVKP